MLNKGDAKIYIYNNSTNLDNGIRANEDASGIIIRNNLNFGGLRIGNSHGDAIVSNNLDGPISAVKNGAAGNFELVAGSPAIDAGTHIPGITINTQGAAPDIGAHEFGTDLLIPGARILEHQASDLKFAHETLHDGSHVIRVTGLEPGRVLADTSALRLDGTTILTDFTPDFDFTRNIFSALFPVDPGNFPTNVSLEFALDGNQFSTASQGILSFKSPALVTIQEPALQKENT